MVLEELRKNSLKERKKIFIVLPLVIIVKEPNCTYFSHKLKCYEYFSKSI